VKTIKKLKNAVFWDVTPCGSCENTSQKTEFFIATAAKTSNLTKKLFRKDEGFFMRCYQLFGDVSVCNDELLPAKGINT
jgi:hypothetical protein